jgi:Hsp70 protein
LQDETDVNSVIPIVGKEALLCLTVDGSDDNHPTSSSTTDNFIYRHVKRVIGTGGKLSADIAAAVPFVQPSTTGKSYKNYNLLNQIDDSVHHPTLLRRHVLVSSTNLTSLLSDPNALRMPVKDSDDSLNGPFIRPEIISSFILQKLKHAAEQATQRRVTRAVIGIPAYFHDGQRNATLAAARRAGFNKVQLLREPEAAALAYGIGKRQQQQEYPIGNDEEEEELVLVFDLGGGTYDVSILSVDGSITEVVCTSGNAQLGGSVWDAKIARHLYQQWVPAVSSASRWEDVKHNFLLCAEAMRIHLSNQRVVLAAFPLQDWSAVQKDPASVILRNGTSETSIDILASSEEKMKESRGTSRTNGTHVFLQLTRREMDQLCEPELQAILRPLREAAIMAGALLPGDSSPSVVAAAMEEQSMGQEGLLFEDFYSNGKVDAGANTLNSEEDGINPDILSTLNRMKESKKMQQRGRKRARDVAKEERKYRQEKKSIGSPFAFLQKGGGGGTATTPKVRDGISGRPISCIVLVGGATRMSCIGRLLAAVTGVTPQKTVNPDEAVALGCAVQVGRLDGVEGMGTVLTPMQAAIVRAMAISESGDTSKFMDDDDEFDSGEVY